MLSLSKSKHSPNNSGQYRDNGLEVFKSTNGLQSEKVKKNRKMCKNKGWDFIKNSWLSWVYVKRKRLILWPLQKT